MHHVEQGVASFKEEFRNQNASLHSGLADRPLPEVFFDNRADSKIDSKLITRTLPGDSAVRQR